MCYDYICDAYVVILYLRPNYQPRGSSSQLPETRHQTEAYAQSILAKDTMLVFLICLRHHDILGHASSGNAERIYVRNDSERNMAGAQYIPDIS